MAYENIGKLVALLEKELNESDTLRGPSSGKIIKEQKWNCQNQLYGLPGPYKMWFKVF